MGRSKSTPSPALKKSMPQNITPKQSLEKSTPGKSATKRPLPEDSDSEDEALELLPQNGILKSKKGKFTVPDDDVSADDVSGDGSDDSEDDEEEGSSAEEEDLEGDQEEDDDDEEDDEDGDDDDDDDDESGSDEPTQNTHSQEAMNKQLPVAATQSATSSIQAPTDTLKKSVPIKSTGPLTHLLIPNPPRQLSQLKTVMSDRGYSVDSLTSLQLHVAFVKLHPNEDLKSLVSGEKPLSVDGKTMHFVQLEGSPDAIDLLTPEANDSLYLSFPKFITVEMIVSKLPVNCRPSSTKLLSNSGRQNMYNAAIFSFSSKCDASTALTALSDVKFNGRTIRVGYLRSRSELKTDSTNSSPESEIRVLNAPKDATIDDLLSLFPGATEAKAAQNCFFVNFPDAITRRKAVTGEKVLKGKVLQITVPGGLDGNFRLIKSIPFDASESELRKAYPEATKITLNHRDDGAFNGSALLEFESAATAQAAVAKNVTMKGRRLFAICSHVEISAAKPAKKQSMKSESHKVHNKAEAPPQVGSASESEDDEEVEERVKPGPQSSQRPGAKPKEEESEDEDDDDDEEEEDEEDEDDDEEEDEDDDEDDEDDEEEEEQESADSGDGSADEEMPLDNSRDKSNFHSKPQFKGRGFNNRGTPTGSHRGGRGFSPRGGRGFGGDRGHRGGHRGGGGGRGRGRGRGGFHRGRGSGQKQRG